MLQEGGLCGAVAGMGEWQVSAGQWLGALCCGGHQIHNQKYCLSLDIIEQDRKDWRIFWMLHPMRFVKQTAITYRMFCRLRRIFLQPLEFFILFSLRIFSEFCSSFILETRDFLRTGSRGSPSLLFCLFISWRLISRLILISSRLFCLFVVFWGESFQTPFKTKVSKSLNFSK